MKKRVKKKQGIQSNKKLEGIGGWLLLLTGWFVIQGITSIYLTISSFYAIIVTKLFNLFLIGQLITTLISFIFIYTLILEFQKKKKFNLWAKISLLAPPILMIFFELYQWNASNPSFRYFKLMLINYLPEIIIAIIGTIYIGKSERVKNTFVR